MSLTLQPTRKAAAIAAVAFATALAGCGSSGTSTASTASTASTGNGAAAVTQNGAPQGTSPGGGGPQGTTPGQGGPGGGMGFDTAALAKALGVTEAKLTAAMQSARPSGGQRPSGTTPPTTPGQGGAGGGPGGGDMFAAIAKALGLSEAKVQKAFQSVMPAGGQGGPPNGQGGAPAATTPSGTAS